MKRLIRQKRKRYDQVRNIPKASRGESANEKRADEIMKLCNEHDWQVIVGIEPDKPENNSDVQWLLKRLHKASPPVTRTSPLKVSPNDYCPCGSGLKYKKCCMNK